MSSAALIPASAALEEARHHHVLGNLLGAAEAYRLALDSDPQSQIALLGLSLIARQSNQLQPALRMAQAALFAGRDSALAWANYGDVRSTLGQTTEAEAAFRRAIAIDSTTTAAHCGLGNLLAAREDFGAALASFQAAVKLAPNRPESQFAMAFSNAKLGARAQAIAGYRLALQLRPGFAAAWLNLGVELIADGRGQLADLCYREALESAVHQHNVSTQISAHLNLGHLQRSRRLFFKAREHYDRALTFVPPNHPRHSEVQVAFAYLHLEERNIPLAWESLHAAEASQAELASSMRNAEIANARGILLLAEESATLTGKIAKLEEGIAAFREAEAQGHKTAGSNRGNALLRLGRCQEALAVHSAALELDANHPGVRYNLALTQLRMGDFARGWPNYEIRWSFREVHAHPRRFTQPRWHGESLEVAARLARIFLYGEQGFGDTIQFCRYLHLVAQRMPNAHLILEVQPSLTSLLTSFVAELARIHPNLSTEVMAHGDSLPPFTYHCPLLSLPAVFGTTLETVPGAFDGHSAYLKADPGLALARGQELARLNLLNHPRIGIAWAGNPNYRADHERSTRLETLLPLLKIPGIQWVSLQKGESANQIGEIQASLPTDCVLYDGCSQDRDFAETAALIVNLDLVIATDSAVAHLAGALGKPLWLMLPWQSDWRWMQDCVTTPWYPTARLFRQCSSGEWPELIDRIGRELADFLKGRESLSS